MPKFGRKNMSNYSRKMTDNKGPENCEFCEVLESGKTMKETEHFFVIDNIYPYEDHHILLLPKRHIHSELDFNEEESEDLNIIHKFILKRYYEEFDMCFYFNRENTPAQSMWHWHRHYLPSDKVLKNGVQRVEYRGLRIKL
jgi:diadenosine tetraphosphate (Ap4A) HIT family hydrolase